MTTEELIEQARGLKTRIRQYTREDDRGDYSVGARAQVCEFLTIYAGPNSAFTTRAESATGYSDYVVNTLGSVLDGFIEYLSAGLATGKSPERQAQLDVVSDYLGQAANLLDSAEFHPAAAAILIGASLEEFLRTWVEAAGIEMEGGKPGIDLYCRTLRSADIISKQDVKDITSWAGTRNDAAHGNWDEVADRSRIKLMLEGVNLFMRKNEGIGP